MKLVYFLVFLPCVAFAQRAEILFDNEYSRLGLIFGPKVLFVSNPEKNIYYEWRPSLAFNAGLSYSFQQNNNLNFRVAAIFTTFGLWSRLYMPTHKNLGSFGSGPYSLLNFPLEAEYLFAKAGKKYFSLNAGLEVGINPLDRGFAGSGGSGVRIGSDSVSVSYNEYAYDSRIMLGVNLGTSVWFAMKSLILRVTPKAHFQFEKYVYRGVAVTQYNSMQIHSRHYLTGDYIGLEISIMPDKLFGR